MNERFFPPKVWAKNVDAHYTWQNTVFTFREREGGEKERERNTDVPERQRSAVCLSHAPSWGLGLQPSMCPAWELNW